MSRPSVKRTASACLLLLMFAALGVASDNPPAPGFRAAESDERAIEIADAVMQAMGGRPAWDGTRYVSWLFFGRRTHYWDRWNGDVRIEAGDALILMNINTRQGRAFTGGVEITEADSLAKMLDRGHAWWVNDSYWVFMPYKLKDSGVRLRYVGERDMQDGRPARVVELTFADVGRTPENKYEVCVDAETNLVGEWSFYRNAEDAEPDFTMPWQDWKRVGNIMLAGDHGRGNDWQLAAYDELPRSVFESPEPVQID